MSRYTKNILLSRNNADIGQVRASYIHLPNKNFCYGKALGIDEEDAGQG